MKNTRILSLILSVVLILGTIPAFSASAAEVTVVDGTRMAFVSSFGRLVYDGTTYSTHKTFGEAFSAIGKGGGAIAFSGNLSLSSFSDISGRAPLAIKGTGNKSSGNLLNFSGIGNLNLCGDLTLDFLNIRLDKDAFIYTNGYTFKTYNEFDTYHKEDYRVGGNLITYQDPPSVAVGSAEKDSTVSVVGGNYNIVSTGAKSGASVNGNVAFSFENATVAKLVSGTADGTLNGNAVANIKNGTVTKAVIGAENGAVNGNTALILDNTTVSEPIVKGAGTVSGKTVVIAQNASDVKVESGAANIVIKLENGKCEPVFEGNSIKGFAFFDAYGLSAKNITLDGASVSSETGIFAVSDGEHTASVAASFDLGMKRNAKYVSGYEDGTFLPQNNITRAEAITLLSRIIVDEEKIKGKISSAYLDVADGAWYESYIGLFELLGFLDTIDKKGGTEILPSQNITRGEFSELIYFIGGIDGTPSSSKLKDFSDVASSHPYVRAIYAAVDAGIVTGYEDGTFKPNSNITRAEAVTMVNRLLGRTPNGADGAVSFSDVGTHWAKGQILAACGDENATWTATPEKAKYVLTGTSAKEYITALYEQSKNLDGTAIREGVNTIAEQMKKDILGTGNTEEYYANKMKGDIYYISEKNGNDENDGKTPATAWKTFEGVRKHFETAPRNTTFLFERGGIYRGKAPIYNHCVYGSYGEGPKPLFMQSKKNYADPSLWVETEYKNVWKLTEQLTNVGVIGFDHDLFDYSEDTYNELYGLIMNKNTRGFDGEHELCGDLQFYSDISAGLDSPGDLFVYSKDGNPGKRFASIEIGEKINIVSDATLNTIVDNIAMKFTGAHGVAYGTCMNMTVTNCVFSWIGGSVLYGGEGKSATNYGNAVQVFGGCNGYYVKNNWMYQIYDTAVTHQRTGNVGDCIQKKIEYTGNLMEYVYWGIEFYNQVPTATQLGGHKDNYKRSTEDVYSAFNLLRLGGYGWGSVTRYRTSQLYCGASGLSENKDCLTEYNIFDRATGTMLNLPSNSNEVDDKNIYIQTLGYPFGSLKGTSRVCTYDAVKDLRKHWGDANAVVVVIDSEIEPVFVNNPEGLAPATM